MKDNRLSCFCSWGFFGKVRVLVFIDFLLFLEFINKAKLCTENTGFYSIQIATSADFCSVLEKVSLHTLLPVLGTQT